MDSDVMNKICFKPVRGGVYVTNRSGKLSGGDREVLSRDSNTITLSGDHTKNISLSTGMGYVSGRVINAVDGSTLPGVSVPAPYRLQETAVIGRCSPCGMEKLHTVSRSRRGSPS